MHNVTREHLKQVQSKLEDRFEEIGKELGLDLKWGRGQYGNAGYLKIEIAALGEGGRPVTPEAEAFKLYCHELGLEPEDLYGTFEQAGEKFEITGFNTRAPKWPLQAKRLSDGQSMKFKGDTNFGKRYKVTREEPAEANAG